MLGILADSYIFPPPRKRALHSYIHGFGETGSYGSLTFPKKATVLARVTSMLIVLFLCELHSANSNNGSGRGLGAGQAPADATAGGSPIEPALLYPHDPYIFSHKTKTSDITPLGGCISGKEVKLTPPAASSFPFLSLSLLQTCNSFA